MSETPDEPKNEAAQELARKRWAKTTKAERVGVAKDLAAARWAGHQAKRPASSRKKAGKAGKKKAG